MKAVMYGWMGQTNAGLSPRRTLFMNHVTRDSQRLISTYVMTKLHYRCNVCNLMLYLNLTKYFRRLKPMCDCVTLTMCLIIIYCHYHGNVRHVKPTCFYSNPALDGASCIFVPTVVFPSG